MLRPDDELPEFAAIERLREDLLRSEQIIRVNDLGAGSRVLDLPIRRVSDIARTSLKTSRQAQLLFRLARYFDPAVVLELGTSFGLSTLYLRTWRGERQGDDDRRMPADLSASRSTILSNWASGTSIRCWAVFAPGSLKWCKRVEGLGMVFIDGHHKKEPTLEYFEQCLGKADSATVFILDDIHWSKGMEARVGRGEAASARQRSPSTSSTWAWSFYGRSRHRSISGSAIKRSPSYLAFGLVFRALHR